MSFLLDTHVLIWFILGRKELGSEARKAIEEARDAVVSTIAVWEIAIKRSRGRVVSALPTRDELTEAGFTSLPVTIKHAWAVAELPYHHGDPFDRMLVAQTRSEGLTLVTADEQLRRYDVSILPAAI